MKMKEGISSIEANGRERKMGFVNNNGTRR